MEKKLFGPSCTVKGPDFDLRLLQEHSNRVRSVVGLSRYLTADARQHGIGQDLQPDGSTAAVVTFSDDLQNLNSAEQYF